MTFMVSYRLQNSMMLNWYIMVPSRVKQKISQWMLWNGAPFIHILNYILPSFVMSSIKTTKVVKAKLQLTWLQMIVNKLMSDTTEAILNFIYSLGQMLFLSSMLFSTKWNEQIKKCPISSSSVKQPDLHSLRNVNLKLLASVNSEQRLEKDLLDS